MKPALCDLALPGGDYRPLLPAVRELGFLGVEVAPHRISIGREPTAVQVTAHRHAVEMAGLSVVGLHAPLAGLPGLGLFGGEEVTRRTLAHLVRCSAMCRDLGGSTLILGGSGRRRGELPLKAAWLACRAFLEELLPRIEPHGTVLCLAPLGRSGGDFCTTAAECRLLTDALEHPSLGLQLNSAAQVENGDTGHVPFSAVRGRLDQFAVCDIGLGVPDAGGPGRHADFRRHLATIGYAGWLVLKQRAGTRTFDTMAAGDLAACDLAACDLTAGARLLHEVYGRGDGHQAFVPPHRPHSVAQRQVARTSAEP